MRHLLSCLILISVISPALSRADEIGALLNTIDGVNRRNTNSELCPEKKVAQVASGKQSNLTPETKSIKAISGEELSISVISEERAGELFKRLRQENLGLKNDSVCLQRAQKMGLVLEQEGVSSGKLFAERGFFGGRIVPNTPGNENGKRRWLVHAASFVYVKKGDKIEEYVFDPVLFKKPVPRSEWESILKSHPDSSVYQVAVASRQAYLAGDMYDVQTRYKPAEVAHATDVLSMADSMHFNPNNYDLDDYRKRFADK